LHFFSAVRTILAVCPEYRKNMMFVVHSHLVKGNSHHLHQHI
jgi:hypothetical protein